MYSSLHVGEDGCRMNRTRKAGQEISGQQEGEQSETSQSSAGGVCEVGGVLQD